jgi:hypothetical protein
VERRRRLLQFRKVNGRARLTAAAFVVGREQEGPMRVRAILAVAIGLMLAAVPATADAARYIQVRFAGSVVFEDYNDITNAYLGQFEKNTAGIVTIDTLAGFPFVVTPDGRSVIAGFSPTSAFLHVERYGPELALAVAFDAVALEADGDFQQLQLLTSSYTEWLALNRYGPTALNGELASLEVRASDTLFDSGLGLTGMQTSVRAVPEPGVWAMLIVGFGCIGAALREPRRRRADA